jgi:hypothetical protein
VTRRAPDGRSTSDTTAPVDLLSESTYRGAVIWRTFRRAMSTKRIDGALAPGAGDTLTAQHTATAAKPKRIVRPLADEGDHPVVGAVPVEADDEDPLVVPEAQVAVDVRNLFRAWTEQQRDEAGAL